MKNHLLVLYSDVNNVGGLIADIDFTLVFDNIIKVKIKKSDDSAPTRVPNKEYQKYAIRKAMRHVGTQDTLHILRLYPKENSRVNLSDYSQWVGFDSHVERTLVKCVICNGLNRDISNTRFLYYTRSTKKWTSYTITSEGFADASKVSMSLKVFLLERKREKEEERNRREYHSESIKLSSIDAALTVHVDTHIPQPSWYCKPSKLKL